MQMKKMMKLSKKKAELLRFILASGCSVQVYRKYFVNSHMYSEEMPKTVETLKRQIRKRMEKNFRLETVHRGIFAN